ncbi:hypothetical protein LCGC14_1526420, partial [marine sediment metagenome]
MFGEAKTGPLNLAEDEVLSAFRFSQDDVIRRLGLDDGTKDIMRAVLEPSESMTDDVFQGIVTGVTERGVLDGIQLGVQQHLRRNLVSLEKVAPESLTGVNRFWGWTAGLVQRWKPWVTSRMPHFWPLNTIDNIGRGGTGLTKASMNEVKAYMVRHGYPEDLVTHVTPSIYALMKKGLVNPAELAAMSRGLQTTVIGGEAITTQAAPLTQLGIEQGVKKGQTSFGALDRVARNMHAGVLRQDQNAQIALAELGTQRGLLQDIMTAAVDDDVYRLRQLISAKRVEGNINPALLDEMEKIAVKAVDDPVGMSKVINEQFSLPTIHFNEVDECAGLDGLMTNHVHNAMGQPVENTLHDIRWGDWDASGTVKDYVWVFLISGSAPPAHFADGFKGASSERQPPMYFRLGGGTLKGISKPGEIVWSRIFIEKNKLKMDLGRAAVVDLPIEETQRRWDLTTSQWPIMHAVTYGVSRDQLMARHKANHIQVVYANSAKLADKALLARGFHIAYMQTSDLVASPKAMKEWDAFYKVLTDTHGLSGKPALVGISRGGLIIHKWAAANPDKVSCIVGVAPVCDIKSWPGGKGLSGGHGRSWQGLLKAYGLTEKQALAYKKNPVDLVEPVAKAKIPILHIYSPQDEGVPYQENTKVYAARLKAAGGVFQGIEKVIKRDGIKGNA